MSDRLFVQAANGCGELERLRAFVEHTQAPALALLARHLARPRYRSAFTQVAVESGQLVGYALLAHTRWRLGAATLDVGRLEALYAPAGRDDLRDALLGACLQTLFEQGLPLAQCVGASAHFAPLGFAPYRFEIATRLAVSGGAGAPLRKAHADDLDDLAALYAASYAALPLTAVRAAPDWRAWLVEPHATQVLEDRDGRVVAYAIAEPLSAGATHIREAAAADAGAARTLLATLSATTEVLFTLPLVHPVTRMALHGGGTARISTPSSAGAPLAGIVDLGGALAALAPEFARRLAHSRYADWTGVVQIETAHERAALAVAPEHVGRADAAALADVRLRNVTLPALAQLCLGHRAAADLRATGALRCDDADLGLLDTLFPVL